MRQFFLPSFPLEWWLIFDSKEISCCSCTALHCTVYITVKQGAILRVESCVCLFVLSAWIACPINSYPTNQPPTHPSSHPIHLLFFAHNTARSNNTGKKPTTTTTTTLPSNTSSQDGIECCLVFLFLPASYRERCLNAGYRATSRITLLRLHKSYCQSYIALLRLLTLLKLRRRSCKSLLAWNGIRYTDDSIQIAHIVLFSSRIHTITMCGYSLLVRCTDATRNSRMSVKKKKKRPPALLLLLLLLLAAALLRNRSRFNNKTAKAQVEVDAESNDIFFFL